jgi:hypothetical protein
MVILKVSSYGEHITFVGKALYVEPERGVCFQILEAIGF